MALYYWCLAMKFQSVIVPLLAISAIISGARSWETIRLMAAMEKQMPKDALIFFRDSELDDLNAKRATLGEYSFESLTYLACRLYQGEWDLRLIARVDWYRLMKYIRFNQTISKLDKDCEYNLFYRIRTRLFDPRLFNHYKAIYNTSMKFCLMTNILTKHDLECIVKRLKSFDLTNKDHLVECKDLFGLYNEQIKARQILQMRKAPELPPDITRICKPATNYNSNSSKSKTALGILLGLAAAGGASIGLLKLLCSVWGKCYWPFSKDNSTFSDDEGIEESTIAHELTTLREEVGSSNLAIIIPIVVVLLILLIVSYIYRNSRIVAPLASFKSPRTFRKSKKRTESTQSPNSSVVSHSSGRSGSHSERDSKSSNHQLTGSQADDARSGNLRNSEPNLTALENKAQPER